MPKLEHPSVRLRNDPVLASVGGVAEQLGRRLRTLLRIRLCITPFRISGVGSTLVIRGTAHPVDALVAFPPTRTSARPRPAAVFELVGPATGRHAPDDRLPVFDTVPSLQHVVRLDLGARRVLVHSRDADLRLSADEVTIIEEPDALVDLDMLDITLPWRSLYDDRIPV